MDLEGTPLVPGWKAGPYCRRAWAPRLTKICEKFVLKHAITLGFALGPELWPGTEAQGLAQRAFISIVTDTKDKTRPMGYRRRLPHPLPIEAVSSWRHLMRHIRAAGAAPAALEGSDKQGSRARRRLRSGHGNAPLTPAHPSQPLCHQLL